MERHNTTNSKKSIRKLRSVDVLIKRKAYCPSTLKTQAKKLKNTITTTKQIETPKRIIRILSPASRVEISSNSESKKYESVRKIDFS
ncbi:hypothetical protein CWI42_081130 [Ordospora colligata]|uniref:Uncharacterized protein n=1 Tax=Ordospora colligata OC4 TaxID=1354746 RepID=A0A0B2UK05_9MICR|nr:uncharacterized protein M896_081130 [Ordospora colligata OC4]KHN69377.1 hypothetical protein M896_081130 [Ordospora colligata OC4]TBU14891.1 hypothetical protein CWI41_081120 [Ordospora colligata]TBU15022.1 hypothetical protein CWI40_081140 [Ordospora colligata]TBU18276.1 hypothetical protein CWI42_081130 [Ordospora colligata]